VKRAAIAVKAVPTFALGNGFDFGRIGGDAQRESVTMPAEEIFAKYPIVQASHAVKGCSFAVAIPHLSAPPVGPIVR
jgi:hypothetical protein